MEQDQEDFELDRLASNNIAENLEFLSNDGDLWLSNLADDPVPTSSNIESADSLHSLDDYKEFNPFWDPSELPAPTQSTSSMQVPQSANPTDDEIFRFVNLDADASYTNHHPSESLAPIETGNSVPAAQSAEFTGSDMFPLDDMDLDAPYADDDLLKSLAPTTTTGFIQAAQSSDLMEDATSRINELDLELVLASPRVGPTSSEQLPPAVITDTINPAEVPHSANSMIEFDGLGPPHPSNLTSHPHSLASSSNEIITDMSTPGKQLRSESGNSLSSRVYVPIQPKPAAISRSTELPSTSESQESSLSSIPSQGILASRPASSVSKGKRKRPRSPHARPSDIPKNIPMDCFPRFHVFEQEAAKDKHQQQPVTKRPRSARTCLRCQMLKKRCSGSFPCENCVIHFGDQAMNRSGITIHWKHCFESNIMQLNFFLEVRLSLFALDCPSVPSLDNEQRRNADLIVRRGGEAGYEMMQIVQNSNIEPGISRLLGYQLHRFVLAKKLSPYPSVDPIRIIMSLLSRESLRRHKTCSHCPDQTWSFAWIFAVTVLQPDFLAELAGFSRQEIRWFSMIICDLFYRTTAKLLAKARTGKLDTVKGERDDLSERLEMIYCLITYHSVRGRLVGIFAVELIQALSPQIVQNLRHKRILSGFMESIKAEGWDGLQAFTRHWLGKLGGGHTRYSQVTVSNIHLNTLYRINHKDKIEDEGQLPPDQYLNNVFGEVYTAFRSLHPGDEVPDYHTKLFIEISSLVKRSMDLSTLRDHQCGGWSMKLASVIIHVLEEEVRKLEAAKGSNELENCSWLSSNDIPDRTPKEEDYERQISILIKEVGSLRFGL